ncbi:hypothetical protein [Neptuniibacter sp. QD37_11]|uniref:hypothetical protein n=1 Tax=Neptuniibacter sp. QD37_11 TaxID=3398209 RepID=UPI0039F48A9E
MRILFVCTQGKDRSRTAAEVASASGIDARYGGVSLDAVRPVSIDDFHWADVIVCMEQCHRSKVRRRQSGLSKKIAVWGVPDHYLYGSDELRSLVKNKLTGGIYA